jgi:hypothetical protein
MRAPVATLVALGYDRFGNNDRLLTERDREIVVEGYYARVDGNAECPVCWQPYRVHPEVQGALWLRRACRKRGEAHDRLVKL